MQPQIIPRSEHCISRKNIDPDALKVLYRLYRSGHTAFLVGGGVRDLLIGRKPKDFDVSTSARPGQVKKLFRNCWLIGRRFRLAHIHFRDHKIIEVATFRSEPLREEGEDEEDLLVRRDNTFGTPEEDALRRDFTINGLFYDIASFSLIDYVGGVDDIESGVIRTIGEPEIRFQEDPVRMIRAVKFAARLDFAIEPHTWNALCDRVEEIRKSSTSRVMEEVARLMEGGASCRSLQLLKASGLLRIILPEIWEYFQGVPAGPGLVREGRRESEAIDDTAAEGLVEGEDELDVHEVVREDFFEDGEVPAVEEAARHDAEEPADERVYDRMDPAVNLGTPYDMPDDAFAGVQPGRSDSSDEADAGEPTDWAGPLDEGDESRISEEGVVDDEDDAIVLHDEEEGPLEDLLTPEGTRCVLAPDRGARLWRMLGAIDSLVRSGRSMTRPTLYAALLTPAAHDTAEFMARRRGEGEDPEEWLPRVLSPLTSGVMISRRDRERVCQIILAQRKCQRKGNFSVHAFSRKPYFAEALDLLELWVLATGEHTEALEWWRERFPPLPPGARIEVEEPVRGRGGARRRGGRGGRHEDPDARLVSGAERRDAGEGGLESERDPQRRRRRRRRKPSAASR